MADRAIIAHPHEVRAFLDGRQTRVTRPLRKLRRFGLVRQFGPSDTAGYDWHFRDKDARWHDLRHSELLNYAPFAVGDRLIVKETWGTVRMQPLFAGPQPPYEATVYRAGKLVWDCKNAPPDYDTAKWPQSWSDDYRPKDGWRSPATMPRWASRLTLTVGDLVCRRVQDVSEDDARAEGVRGNAGGSWGCEGLIEDYADLWNSLHGPDAWTSNPWVWSATVSAEARNIDAAQAA